VPAAGQDELDGAVEIGFAVRDPLGERQRVAGVQKHVEPPALHLRPFALPFRQLCHLAHFPPWFALMMTNPPR
jgi:hypothetical protein